MKNRLLFTVILAVVMAIGEGFSSPQAMATITGMAILGPHPTDAASWGEVQAQRFVEVSSPSDSNPIAYSNQRPVFFKHVSHDTKCPS